MGTARTSGKTHDRVLHEASPLDTILDGFDAVIHTAGATPSNATEPEAYRTSVEFSRRLAEAVKQSDVRIVIHLSSVAALGGVSRLSAGVLDDSWDPAPVTDYGRSKQAAESHFEATVDSGRLVVNLRPPLVFGSGARGAWASLMKLARSPLPLPFAKVANRRSFLGMTNLCGLVDSILARAGEGSLSGTFLAADRETVSLCEICSALRHSLGRRPGLFSVPVAVMATPLGWAGREEMAAGLFGDLVIDSSRVMKTFAWIPGEPTLDGMARSLTFPSS